MGRKVCVLRKSYDLFVLLIYKIPPSQLPLLWSVIPTIPSLQYHAIDVIITSASRDSQKSVIIQLYVNYPWESPELFAYAEWHMRSKSTFHQNSCSMSEICWPTSLSFSERSFKWSSFTGATASSEWTRTLVASLWKCMNNWDFPINGW